MKRVLISFPGLMNGALFRENARDNCLEPFIVLRDELGRHGFSLETADSLEFFDCAAVWFWDAKDFSGYVQRVARTRSWPRPVASVLQLAARRHLPKLYQGAIQAGLQSTTVLFTGEPPSVLPINFDPHVHSLFSRVLTWHDGLVDEKKYHKFLYPQPGVFPVVEDLPFSDRRLLVSFCGRKQSTHERELYSRRLQLIRLLDSLAPTEIALYGPGWEVEMPALISYRGLATNKWDIYPSYKFGLCYENILDEPGYVTEKIFDCLRSKCVPVYWGAGNIESYVPKSTFIDRREFESDEALVSYLRSMSEFDFSRLRKAGDEYICSKSFARFCSSAFAEDIIQRSGLLSAQP